MKKFSLLFFALILSAGTMLAQRTITGTIVDNTGESLIGANVLAKGTAVGTITDIDGSFSLDVPDGTTMLVISFTGYESQEIDVTTASVVDVVLTEGELLDEVVVTGLGIKRDKKALGYAVSTLDSDIIQNRSEADVARILRGKATGVDITTTSGMAGSGTNVIIRGYSSITGNNQPLFVIDGVPFNTDTNSDRGFDTGGSTASSRFLDLDPNSIAEISVLKGLSATVLYGEAGRNGVILVTTKNGNAGENSDKGLEVSLTQSISRAEVANLPDYQNTYGNGFGGNFGWFFSNWGAPFDNPNPSNFGASDLYRIENGQAIIRHPYDQAQYNDDFPEFIGAEYVYQPYESVENFFQPGLISNTSLSIENNLGNGSSVSATYSYLDQAGFTPKLDEQRGGGASNFIRKHNFGLGAKTKLSNGFNIKGSFNFVESESRIPPAGPGFGGDGNGLFAALIFTPRSIDLNNLPYQSPIDGSNVYYRRGSAIQNPRWTLNNSWDEDLVKRFFGTIQVDREITPWLSAMYRLGIDQYAQTTNRKVNRGGPQDINGRYETGQYTSKIADHVLNLMYNKDINDDFSLDGIVGVNFRKQDNARDFVRSTDQFVYGLMTHDNFIQHVSFSDITTENTIGAYATATLGYRNFLYVNLQARNDWTSTLESANRSVFYPSASLSFVPTDAFQSLQNNRVLNYLKLRVGYGTSAGYPDPYQTRSVLQSSTNQFVAGNGSILNVNSGRSTTEVARLGNPDLQAEKHREIEVGVEARFLDNRVGVDLSLYNKKSSDLIIDLDLDPSTGYTNTTVNAAELENRGIELGLNFTPVRIKDFQWDFTLNYTKNRSEVLAIADGVDQVLIDGYTDLGNFALLGEQYGIIQGTAFVKDDAGNLVVNNVGSYIEDSELQPIGDPNPNYTANWINNFSWKGLSFGFQFSYQDGGDVWSSTIAALLARGNTVDTDVDRFIPVILPGVEEDGSVNDIQGYMGNYFFDAYFGASEGSIFDATNIRLREISLSYVIPSAVLENTPFGRAALTFSGENLWYKAVNVPVGTNFDPEVLSLGVGNGRGFDFRTGPTSKKVGVTLNLTF